jgi:hypothetical protein
MSQKIALLFVAWSLLWVIAPSPMANTLHAIVIADTRNESGASFDIDLKRIKELAGTVSIHTRLKLQLYEISGNNLTRHKVTSTLEQLSVEQNDVILFHYAGHGGRASNKSIWPSMDIEGGALDLEWIESILKQKNPRFLIILADTCNHFDDSLSPVWTRNRSSRGPPQTVSYRQLFLNYRGHVFAAAAKPGQFAWGNAQYGGFFTDAFLNSLNKELTSSNPNWHTLMKRTEAPINAGGETQNPQSKVDIRPVHAGASEPVPDQCYYFYKPNGILCCRTSNGTTCDGEQQSHQQEGACPSGGLFMKPGGQECCRRPTGITCN